MDAHEQELRDSADAYTKAHQRRDKAIVNAARAGMTRRKIGELVGLSYARIHQIVQAAKQH